MRIFVEAGKGKKDIYTVLPQTTLKMLRKYYQIYKPKHKEGYKLMTHIQKTMNAIEKYMDGWGFKKMSGYQ